MLPPPPPLDIDRFPTMHMAVGKFLISEPSQGTVEKFKPSSAHPNSKYNCVELFLSYCINYIFI